MQKKTFFVPEEDRWSKISSAAHTPEIGTVVNDAMRAIEKENASLKNVLHKNYANPDLDKRVFLESLSELNQLKNSMVLVLKN